MQGSNIEGILAWAAKKLNGMQSNFVSPLSVADTLEMYSNISFASLSTLPKPIHQSPTEINQTLSDIQGFALIGKYYAEKIRAACDLALFDATQTENYRKTSLQHLQLAKNFWSRYASVYAIKNKAALYNRVGYVDVEKLKTKVQQDIDMVVKWKAGQNKLIPNGNTEVPFKQ
jgi:hypothetical protein